MKQKHNNLFFKSGKPKAKAFELLYSLGRDSFKRLTDMHKKALVSYALNPTDTKIIDTVFTSTSTVEIKYVSNGILKTENCLFDSATLEFHSMPIHIEHENRYEDFRSRGALEFILKLEEFINN